MSLTTVWTRNGLSNKKVTAGMNIRAYMNVKAGGPAPVFEPGVKITVWTRVNPAS